MPFGQHRGKRVEEVPEDYLRWLWDAVPLYGPLRGAVKRLLEMDCVPKGAEAPGRCMKVVEGRYQG